MIISIITVLSMCLLFLFYRLWMTSRRLSCIVKERAKAEMQLEQDVVKQENLTNEVIELRERIKLNVLTDPITKLPSRQVMEDHFVQLLHQSNRYHLLFGLLLIDIDEFKVINNALGYDRGDELLYEIAKKIQDSVRKIDTVSRFRGNTFLVLLPQLTKPERAALAAKRILDAIAEPCQVEEERELFITASIGLAIYPSDGEDLKTLIKCADNALHQARLRGGNTYQFYHQEMQYLSRRELTLISSLRSASVFQDFLIYYQPVVDAQSKKIISMEALLRWKHSDFGIISPQEFLRLAENSGKIVAIGEWVVHNACEQLLRWHKEGFSLETVSVNISMKQLENPHFVLKLTQIVRSLGLEPNCLLLEIAEASLRENTEIVEKSLYLLKQLGVQIAIDNFGSGSLSLQQLRRFPIDAVKLDASLIWDISVNRESSAMIKAIMALADSLQWRLIVKGVETHEQRKLLSDMNCHLMQGYLFSRPALASEFSGGLEHVMQEVFK